MKVGYARVSSQDQNVSLHRSNPMKPIPKRLESASQFKAVKSHPDAGMSYKALVDDIWININEDEFYQLMYSKLFDSDPTSRTSASEFVYTRKPILPGMFNLH